MSDQSEYKIDTKGTIPSIMPIVFNEDKKQNPQDSEWQPLNVNLKELFIFKGF